MGINLSGVDYNNDHQIVDGDNNIYFNLTTSYMYLKESKTEVKMCRDCFKQMRLVNLKVQREKIKDN